VFPTPNHRPTLGEGSNDFVRFSPTAVRDDSVAGRQSAGTPALAAAADYSSGNRIENYDTTDGRVRYGQRALDENTAVALRAFGVRSCKSRFVIASDTGTG